jgi:hypothetical protein
MMSLTKLVLATFLFSQAQALAIRGNSHTGCSFTISSGTEGEVGQLSDGQNRLLQGLPPAHYCINDGKITDSLYVTGSIL